VGATLEIGGCGNISTGFAKPNRLRGKAMAKWLLILLLPVVLAGCVTGQGPALPMALAPSDTAQASCLGDAPTFGDCKGTGAGSISQETK
jgi:hypothetical protein